LARRAVVQQTGLSYGSISLDRTEKGKPFLVNCPPSCDQFDFNVSHDGDYAVVAAESHHLVGVDVMQVDRSRMFAYTMYSTRNFATADGPHDAVSLKILLTVQTTCTTNPYQIEVIELKGYS